MSDFTIKLRQLEERIQKACDVAKRPRSDVVLLPVSKGHGAELINEALESGLCPMMLGENYLDELVLKSEQLKAHKIEWHFLGRLQSRKIKDIAQIARVVHGVSRAQELEALKPYDSQFYIQVNVSGEGQKNGVAPSDLPALLNAVELLKLTPRFLGLMGMSLAPSGIGEQLLAGARQNFAELRSLRDQYAPHAKLNMGMSDDFEEAILQGSNLIRVGSAFFGLRSKNQ